MKIPRNKVINLYKFLDFPPHTVKFQYDEAGFLDALEYDRGTKIINCEESSKAKIELVYRFVAIRKIPRKKPGKKAT